MAAMVNLFERAVELSLEIPDDALMVFSLKNDAKRVMAVLAKRFGRFGLSFHL